VVSVSPDPIARHLALPAINKTVDGLWRGCAVLVQVALEQRRAGLHHVAAPSVAAWGAPRTTQSRTHAESFCKLRRWAARRRFNSSAPAQLLLNSCVTSAACKPCTSRTRHADAASRPAIARLTVALAQQPGLKPASEATAGCVGHFKRRGTDTVWLGPAARRPCRGARATVTAGIEQTGMAKLPDVGQQAGQEAPTPPSGVSSPSCFRVLLLAQVLTINTVPHLSVSPRTVTAHRASQNV